MQHSEEKAHLIPQFLIAPSAAASGLYADCAIPGGVRGDSGIDLRFAEDVVIPSCAHGGLPVIVDLQIRARCVVGGAFVPFLIVPRSSIGKTPLSLANSVGTIDSGYQGSIKVALRNHSNAPWLIRQGDALVQLVRPDFAPAFVAITDGSHVAFAETSARGAGGFGSTGNSGVGCA